MSWDDLYMEIYYEMKELGLKEEFDSKLKKMDSQEKHRYKDTRERWRYASEKVKKENKK